MHGWHEFRKSRDFAAVGIVVCFAKVGKTTGGRVNIHILAQPTLNVIVHGIQQLAVQQLVFTMEVVIVFFGLGFF